jgi:hypothetical protein
VNNIVVPGKGTDSFGSQLIWVSVNTNGWSVHETYRLVWTLGSGDAQYSDANANNNLSEITPFSPGSSGAANAARPGLEMNMPNWFKNTNTPGTSATVHSWSYWTYDANGFRKVTESNKSIQANIILTPENQNFEGDLAKPLSSNINSHNYLTRSGYGLSLNRVHEVNGQINRSHVTVNANMDNMIGTPYIVMSFPEFNYSTGKHPYGSYKIPYSVLTTTYENGQYLLSFPELTDYNGNDEYDKHAHYTPLWLPDGEYTPVTHIGGMWSPIGEMQATITQGTSNAHLGLYSNHITVEGSMYDDMYPNA